MENPLDFVELHGFFDDWKALRLDDDDLAELQNLLMERPDVGKGEKQGFRQVIRTIEQEFAQRKQP